MWGARPFIYVCYMVYGGYVYAFHGQNSNQLACQGLSPHGWQTACNFVAVISGSVAATLYAHIGIKVIYNNVLVELLHAPPLYTKQGKHTWAAVVPLYWSIAFLLARLDPGLLRAHQRDGLHLLRPVHLPLSGLPGPRSSRPEGRNERRAQIRSSDG
jgi:hypothetical protein